MSKTNLLPWITATALLLAIVSGAAVVFSLIKTPAEMVSGLDQPLPDQEIVFFVDFRTLGFIHPDGTGYETRKIDLSNWDIIRETSPTGFDTGNEFTWGPDGQALAGRFAVTNRSSGVPFIISADGQPMGCSQDRLPLYGRYRSWFVSNTQILTVNHSTSPKHYTVEIVDLKSCQVIKSLYVSSSNEGVGEANLSVNDWLAVSIGHAGSSEIKIINSQGMLISSIPAAQFPVWSPDGKFIAYSIPRDGLFIAAPDGTGQRKLVDDQLPNELMPSWSPDGKWIVYHRKISTGVSIFKVDVANGQEYELFRGGTHPNWRQAQPLPSNEK